MPLVYQELRRRAAAHLRRERREHTLQPTALVHEAYLRLIDQRRAVWQNRAQFFGVASQMMRRILVDRARARRTAKRSGRWSRVTLDDAMRWRTPADVDVLDLDNALTRLAAFDLRKSQIAELRFFAGLSLEETGKLLGVSRATVESRLAGSSRVALQGTVRRAARGMTPERGRQIIAVFHDALARDAEARESFLDEACAGDETLRAEVIGLLDAHHNAREFGARPLVELLHDAADVSADLGSSDTESVPGIAGPG